MSGANNENRHTGHLQVSGLQKKFGDFVAVEDLNLDVRPGEFIALLGPSGCGKTTVLRSIAGLIASTRGDIHIDGRSIVGDAIYKRDIGMVFQSYALFPHMSVRQNVGFGLKMRSVPTAELNERVGQVLDLIRMRDYVDHYPAQLSGGQQQRIALARAVVTNPNVLLLDEPFSALDAKLRESMQIELRQLQKRLGITTVFVTHDQHEALTMVDRIAVMNAGRMEQFDAPQVIYDNPKTLFVAEFIGRMNRISGRLAGRRENRATLRLAGQEGECAARDNPDIDVGEDVVAVLRPERIELLSPDADPYGYAAVLRGRVSEVIFTGEKITVFLDTPCGPLIVAVQNRSVDRLGVQVGQEIGFGWEANDMMIFSAGDVAGALK